MSPDLIHIVDDDWGMRALHPLAALDELRADIARSAAHLEEARDPKGYGYSSVHMIAEPEFDYLETGLTLVDAEAALQPIMPRVPRFYATCGTAIGAPVGHDPFGSYEEAAWCFGLAPNCFIKLEPSDELVKSIWFECCGLTSDQHAALCEGFLAINRLARSAVADYRLGMAGSLSDREFQLAYFRALLNREQWK